jgi:signal peptidase II
VTDGADQPAGQGQPNEQGRPNGQDQPPGRRTGATVAGRRRTTLLAVTALAVLAADLVTKMIAVEMLADRPPLKLLGGLLYLTEARNSGAAFSFAQGATVLFTAVAVVVVAVIVRTASRLRSAQWALCLGLILGGAAGNLADRLFRSPGPLRGEVIDWISVLDPHGRVWPIFNIADSAIVCGGILAVVLAALGYEVDGRRHVGERPGQRRRRTRAAPPPPDQPREETGR